ncbi:hypothetical protein F5B18DRAFT_29469 [Nemania serpens]|nr:hypothetical protein F5B18DRAFT_29469 [Nemania serpens]
MPYLSLQELTSQTYAVGSSEISEVESSETSEVKSETSEDQSSEMLPPLHMKESMAVFSPTDRSLIAETIRFYNMPVSDFSSSLFHSSARTIELINCEWSLRAEVPLSINTAPRIIHLLGTSISWNGFGDIMTCFPCMHTLVYTRPADEIDTHFDLVGGVLAHYGTELEHLTMLNENYMPFCSPLGSLNTLTNLRSLEIHLELLIGFRENPNGYEEYMGADIFDPDDAPDYEEINRYAGDWSLLPLLPPSLEKLILHVEDPKLEVYFNTYDRYGAKLEELVTAEHLFERLTDISAPGLAEVEKRIRARHTGWVLTAQSAMQRPSMEARFEDCMGDCEERPMEASMDNASIHTFKSEGQSS